MGNKTRILSGFHRNDTLTPVITITVYLGAEAWDGPRSLHEMFGTLDEELKPWIPDYRINLLAPQEIEDFSVFRTEVGQLLQFIRASESEQEVQKTAWQISGKVFPAGFRNCGGDLSFYRD